MKLAAQILKQNKHTNAKQRFSRNEKVWLNCLDNFDYLLLSRQHHQMYCCWRRLLLSGDASCGERRTICTACAFGRAGWSKDGRCFPDWRTGRLAWRTPSGKSFYRSAWEQEKKIMFWQLNCRLPRVRPGRGGDANPPGLVAPTATRRLSNARLAIWVAWDCFMAMFSE